MSWLQITYCGICEGVLEYLKGCVVKILWEEIKWSWFIMNGSSQL